MADHHHFTTAERRELFLQCAMGVLEALAGGLGEAATLQVLIDVVQSDMARLALVTAQVASVRSVIGLLLGPTGGAVTDSVGRKPSLLAGRLFGGAGGGGLVWRLYLLLWPRKTVSSYVGFQILLSVLSCGSGASLAASASIDDRFGSRPALRAAFSARSSAWAGGVGLLSPVLGAMLYRRQRRLGLLISVLCVVCCLPVVQLMSESLPRERRRKQKRTGRLLQNPISNLATLFTHSRKLAHLAAAEVLHHIASTNSPDGGGGGGNIQALALDKLHWAPADLSLLRSFVSAGQLCHGWLLPILTRRASGVRGAFRSCSCGLIVAHALLSQCWRPIGGKQRPAAFVMAEGLRAGIGQASPVCSRALLVEAAVADGLGTGELNAALAGVRSISGAVTPIAWAVAYSAFGRWGHGRWYYTPGGTWLMEAAMHAVVLRLVSQATRPASEL
jgi:hypothetical protein